MKKTGNSKQVAHGSSSHKIGWLNLPGYKGETWNPIIGCSKVSAGCENCYAEKMAHRLVYMPFTDYYAFVMSNNGEDDPEKFKYIPTWNGETYLVQSQLDKPLRWKKPRVIFVCSMGDLFHENTSFEEINAVFSVMADNDQHIFIVLTKRPQRMISFYEWKQAEHGVPWQPSENVWMGITAENQKLANERIPKLLSVPAAVRFVSIEPMLGPVDLEHGFDYGDEIAMNFLNGDYITNPHQEEYSHSDEKLDWVIVGGESGHKARPMHPDWVRSVRDQCTKAGVPFFFKQWGKYLPHCQAHVFERDHPKQFPSPHNPEKMNTYYKVGKSKSGNMLDGVRYENYPKIN